MAHFARVDKKTNKVLQVHVVNNFNLINSKGFEDENLGIEYLNEIHKNKEWIGDVFFVQCSYTNKIRGCYPGINYVYNVKLDKFEIEKLD